MTPFGVKTLPASRFLFPLLVFCLMSPVPARAEDTTFRCGSETVSAGDSSYTVLKTCGKPARKEKTGTREKEKKQKTPPGTKTSKTKSTPVEKWYYDSGYGDFVYVLSFEGGVLQKVEKGGRGR